MILHINRIKILSERQVVSAMQESFKKWTKEEKGQESKWGAEGEKKKGLILSEL